MVTQIILVSLAALMQGVAGLHIFGSRPDFALIILIPLIFFIENWLAYAVLVIISALLLKSTPWMDLPVAIFMAVLIGAYFLKKILPWQSFFISFIFLILATIIINLPDFFFGELLLNLILGTIVFYILKWVYE